MLLSMVYSTSSYFLHASCGVSLCPDKNECQIDELKSKFEHSKEQEKEHKSDGTATWKAGKVLTKVINGKIVEVDASTVAAQADPESVPVKTHPLPLPPPSSGSCSSNITTGSDLLEAMRSYGQPGDDVLMLPKKPEEEGSSCAGTGVGTSAAAGSVRVVGSEESKANAALSGSTQSTLANMGNDMKEKEEKLRLVRKLPSLSHVLAHMHSSTNEEKTKKKKQTKRKKSHEAHTKHTQQNTHNAQSTSTKHHIHHATHKAQAESTTYKAQHSKRNAQRTKRNAHTAQRTHAQSTHKFKVKHKQQ